MVVTDYLEELFDLCAALTFYAPVITPQMWAMYDQLISAVGSWALDFMNSAPSLSLQVVLPLSLILCHDHVAS
jgi:hypothetical protein